MLSISIDDLIKPTIIKDLIYARDRLCPPEKKVRLYRIPIDEFNKAVNSILIKHSFMPFRPILLGLPVDMSERDVPECVCVADDDSNISQSPIRIEDEFNGKEENKWQQ